MKAKLGNRVTFEVLINDLKSQGKSTESAKAITASIGRGKYWNTRLQKLAIKGKKASIEK